MPVEEKENEKEAGELEPSAEIVPEEKAKEVEVEVARSEEPEVAKVNEAEPGNDVEVTNIQEAVVE